MAITETDQNGGRSDPAAVPACREAVQRFELWPHRSLSLRGVLALVAAVTVGVALPLCLVPPGRALALVAVPCLSAPLALGLAFWANNRAARMKEEIRLTPDVLSFTRSGPAARSRSEAFNPYWVRIEVRSDGRIAHRILMSEGRRRVAVGDFLSPDERLELARALRARLGAGRVALPAACASLETDWQSADDFA